MKNYARIQDCIVMEIIVGFMGDDGQEVPIEERFTPEIVATLVAIPDGATVEVHSSYANGQFGPPPVFAWPKAQN